MALGIYAPGWRLALVPFNQSELLVTALQAASADITFHPNPGGGHGGPRFETEEVRRAVGEFFDGSLL